MSYPFIFPMHITIHYMAQLKRLVGKDSEALDIPEGLSLPSLLAQLAQERGSAIGQIILDHQGRPRSSLLVFLGDDQVQPDSCRPLREGDVLTLLTPMAGG